MDRAKFSPTEAALFRRLDEARSLMPDVEIALFGAEDGGYIKSPDKTVSKGYDPRTRPWYSDIIRNNTDLSVTDPYVSSTTKTLVTTVSARVKNERGETIGVAGVDFVLGALTEVLGNARVGHTGYLLLFDRNGKIMLDPKAPANLMKAATEVNDPGLATLAAQAPGRHNIQRGGTELVALSRVMKGTGWKAVMVMERSEQRAVAIGLIKNIVVAIGIAGLVILAVGIMISRTITHPLTVLMGQVSDIADGRFNALDQGPRSRSPEIIALQSNLRRMVIQIQELILSSKSKADEAEEQSSKARAALAEAENARRTADEATHKGRLEAAAQLESIVKRATDSAKKLEAQIERANGGTTVQLDRTEKAQSIVEEMHTTVADVAREAN